MRDWSIASIIAARAGSAVKLASESAEGGAHSSRRKGAASSISRSRKPTSSIEQAPMREHCLVPCWSRVGGSQSQQTRGVSKGRLYDLSSPDDKSCKHCA